MRYDKKEPPAPKSPLLSELMWQIHAEEAREEKDLLTEIVMYYIVHSERCNLEKHIKKAYCLYLNLSSILEYQEGHLPAQR